jgi:hypothetical protein
VPHRYSDLDEMSDGEFGTYVQVLIMQEEYWEFCTGQSVLRVLLGWGPSPGLSHDVCTVKYVGGGDYKHNLKNITYFGRKIADKKGLISQIFITMESYHVWQPGILVWGIRVHTSQFRI